MPTPGLLVHLAKGVYIDSVEERELVFLEGDVLDVDQVETVILLFAHRGPVRIELELLQFLVLCGYMQVIMQNTYPHKLVCSLVHIVSKISGRLSYLFLFLWVLDLGARLLVN